MAVLQRAHGLHGVCSAASTRLLRPVASYARAPRRLHPAVHAVAQPQRDSTAVEPRVVPQTPEASSSGRTASPLEQLRSWLSRSETRALSFVTAAAGAGLLGSGFDLQGPGSVLQAIGVLAAIITVHECGHFLAARLQGIHVTQFAIGFGPPLFRYKVGRGGLLVHALATAATNATATALQQQYAAPTLRCNSTVDSTAVGRMGLGTRNSPAHMLLAWPHQTALQQRRVAQLAPSSWAVRSGSQWTRHTAATTAVAWQKEGWCW
jgi:hypothetical protein